MVNKKGFTLVELIVVITILAILGTIGFISYSDYSSSSRDLVRKVDIGNSEKVLDLYYLDTSRYPEPHEGVDVVHSGATVWTQGSYGQTTFNMMNKIFGDLVDPLTGSLYTYSVTRNRSEYQLGAALESPEEELELTMLNNSYADTLKSYIVGNYNELFAYATLGLDHYIISTPSIIATDLLDHNITTIIGAKKIAYNGLDGLPGGYGRSGTGIELEISDPIIYKGTKKDLGSYKGIKQINDKLKNAYFGSIIEEDKREFFNSTNLDYMKSILSNVVGVNPIEPYYCNEILENSGYENLALDGNVVVTGTIAKNGTNIAGINNAIIRTNGKYDYEYHSKTKGGFVELEWPTSKNIGKIILYNRTKTRTNRLKGAVVTLYDSIGSVIYTKTLGVTAGLDQIIVDLNSGGQTYNAKKIKIKSRSNQYLNLREVEVFEKEVSISSGYYTVDSDGIGGSDSYEVFCDMENSGGGWTRVGDNHIRRGDFSGGFHTPNYDQVSNRENEVVSITSPIDSGYGLWSHKVSANDFSYALRLNDISLLEKGYELRLSARIADAWNQGSNINGGYGYIFNNTLTYTNGSTDTNGYLETLDTVVIGGKTWKKQMLIIPVTKNPKSFVWNLGKGTETGNSRNFYVTALKAEIFYK